MITLPFHLQPQYKYRASHRYRGGHGFKSQWSPDFFQASSFQLLKLENLLRWSHFPSFNVAICFVEIVRSFGRGFRLFITSLFFYAAERRSEAGAQHAGFGAVRRAKRAKRRFFSAPSQARQVSRSALASSFRVSLRAFDSIQSNKTLRRWRAGSNLYCDLLATHLFLTDQVWWKGEALQVENQLKSLWSWKDT